MTGWAALLPLAVVAVAGCATTFWDRPGATRLTLADDTERCYRRAVDVPFPAALPRVQTSGVPADRPPPALWRRSPGEAGFATFDQEQRFERCMREGGYRSTRPSR